MKTELILAIPHSSTHIVNDGTIEKTMFPGVQRDALLCADLYTDFLFDYPDAKKIICPVSRMMVDVERFLDKEKEEMASFNRGAFYKVLNDGKTIFRKNINIDLLDIYVQYHKELSEAVELVKEKNKEPFIIDCHSFNEQPFCFDKHKDIKDIYGRYKDIKDIEDRKVDFCFGYNNKKDIPKNVFAKIRKWAAGHCFSYNFNVPYSGSITTDTCTRSLMIEVNKRIYLEEDNITPNSYMNILQLEISKLLDSIKED